MNCSRSTNDMEAAVGTIGAMCHQEDVGYRTADYLNSYNNCLKALDVDADCRKKMAAWSFQVVDFCKFNRESVEVALSYLDRFLLTTSGVAALQDRSVFQLVAMTSLYTAVKIHEPEAMDPKLVSSLSRGTYSPEDVEQMETVILQALSWRMNPPTALSFVRQFYNLIPSEAMDEQVQDQVQEIIKFQTELANSEYEFITVKASVVAYCSCMNALTSLDIDPKIIQYVSSILQQALGISCTDDLVIMDVQSYLLQAVVREYDLAPPPPAVCHHSNINKSALSSPPMTPVKPVQQRSAPSPRSSLQVQYS